MMFLLYNERIMYTFSSKIIFYTKKAYTSIFIAVISLLLLLPTFSVRGEDGQDHGITGSTGDITGPTGETGSGVTNISVQIENPITPDTLENFIKAILDIVLTIGIPIVALAIIYSGFLFVTAQGNEEKLTTAKKTFLFVIVGAAILLGAWVLAQAIGGTIEDIRSAQ